MGTIQFSESKPADSGLTYTPTRETHWRLSMRFRSVSLRTRWSLTVATTVVTGAIVLTGPTAVGNAQPSATPYGVNLLRNGDAESVPGSEWHTAPSGSFRRHKYTEGEADIGFPSPAEGHSIGGGKRFFWAGPYNLINNGCGNAKQRLELNGIGAAIDSGHVRVTLRGYAGTDAGEGMTAHTDLYFRNAGNHAVSSNGITKRATRTLEHYRAINKTKTLPAHTRILRLHLWASGEEIEATRDCHAFWDNISVVVSYV